MERTADTNQRMFFDVNSSGGYLCSGNTNGTVSMWNISELNGKESDEGKDGSEMRESANSKEEVQSPVETNSVECVPLLLSFQAHEDCVNGIRYSIAIRLPGIRVLCL